MDEIICGACLLPKTIDQFYRHAKRGHQAQCKECKAEYNRKHYIKDKELYLARAKASKCQIRHDMREFVAKMKARPCMDCGGEFPPYVMDFDHVRSEKFMNISSMRDLPIELIEIEIAKCELVCANCHRIRTHNRLHL